MKCFKVSVLLLHRDAVAIFPSNELLTLLFTAHWGKNTKYLFQNSSQVLNFKITRNSITFNYRTLNFINSDPTQIQRFHWRGGAFCSLTFYVGMDPVALFQVEKGRLSINVYMK